MDNLVFELHQVEMRNVELPHGAERQLKGLVAVRPSRGAHLLAELSQGAEDARPVEPLPFAMFAVIHDYSALHRCAPPRALAEKGMDQTPSVASLPSRAS